MRERFSLIPRNEGHGRVLSRVTWHISLYALVANHAINFILRMRLCHYQIESNSHGRHYCRNNRTAGATGSPYLSLLIRKDRLRRRGQRIKHLYDWMAHASNLAKESPTNLRLGHSACTPCKCRMYTSFYSENPTHFLKEDR